jgi:hypothetical protein
MKKSGVVFRAVAAFRDDSLGTLRMKKVSLALAAVLALASLAGGCATPAPEKTAPVIRKG